MKKSTRFIALAGALGFAAVLSYAPGPSAISAAAPRLAPAISAPARPPASGWVRTYNGPANNDDQFAGIAFDPSGGVIVTGWSMGIGTDLDFVTIRYGSNGSRMWVKRYDGPAHGLDTAYGIASDGSGNIWVTGWSRGEKSGLDLVTIKYSADGAEIWEDRYDGPAGADDRGYEIVADGTGNVYVVGQTTSKGAGIDYVTIKYNANGRRQWVRRYDGPAHQDDIVWAAGLDSAGNVCLTGRSFGKGTGLDYATVKYTAAGGLKWVRRYNGPGDGDDGAWALAVDGSDNVYVSGESYDKPGGDSDFATVKYSPLGTQLWVQRYSGPGRRDDKAWDLALDGAGNVFAEGYGWGKNEEDYLTVKYTSEGVQLWERSYDGPGHGMDEAYSAAVDGSGNVYVTGGCLAPGAATRDCVTLKYSPSGARLWARRYSGVVGKSDGGWEVAVDGAGGVYVIGHSSGLTSGRDGLLIKY